MERLRRTVRALIPFSLYRRGSAWYDAAVLRRREGRVAWATLNRRGPDATEIRLSALQAPLIFRPGTDDRTAILQNIVREEYGARPLVDQPRWMIDAGAYIGDVSAYFASRFPKLRIVALEPNPEAFALLQRNAAPYAGRIAVENAALWSRPGELELSGAQMGAAVAEKAGGSTRATTIPALLRQYDIAMIDILKVDIEGAESVVFAEDPEWLERVRMIIIEVHGDERRRTLRDVFTAHGFDVEPYRSVWYVRHPHRVNSPAPFARPA